MQPAYGPGAHDVYSYHGSRHRAHSRTVEEGEPDSSQDTEFISTYTGASQGGWEWYDRGSGGVPRRKIRIFRLTGHVLALYSHKGGFP